MASIYIAGPMRGIENNNVEAFTRAEERLRSRGFQVFNPVRIGRGIATDEEINSDEDLLRIVMCVERSVAQRCDAIYLLRGWEHSEGAKHELSAAIRKGCDVLLESEDLGARFYDVRMEDRQ